MVVVSDAASVGECGEDGATHSRPAALIELELRDGFGIRGIERDHPAGVTDGHTPRPLQEKAISRSLPQSSQRARAKPCARMPQRRYSRESCSTQYGTPSPMGVGFGRVS